MTRTIVIGDVHGCREELEALLAEVGPKKSDTVVFAGDLFDRGPDSLGVVRVIRELTEKLNVVLVAGNHDEKHSRFRGHFNRNRETGKRIPMLDLDGEMEALCEALDPKDQEMLDSAVLYHQVQGHNMIVVHAGVTPRMEDLPPAGTMPRDVKGKPGKVYLDMLRVRHVDLETGRMVSLDQTDPSVHVHWTKVYDGRFGRVVYGHEPYFGHEKPVEGYLHRSVGVDLGCVYGGRLAALVVHQDGTEESVSVEATLRPAMRG